jgi:hypothetical protein
MRRASLSAPPKVVGRKEKFEKNILTFNPGWDQNAHRLAQFTDVRELQRQLRAQGVQFQQQADKSTTGPASFVAVDPDGSPSCTSLSEPRRPGGPAGQGREDSLTRREMARASVARSSGR